MKAVARTRRHRVILLTGCRSGEIGRLKSYEVEPAKLILADSKTDRQDVHVGSSKEVSPGLRQPDDAGDTLIFDRRGGESDLDAFPVSHYGGEGEYMAVVLDFPDGDKLTEFVKLYLVSYFLGMLARYHPSIWMALLRNEKGDFAQPLLVDAVEAIEKDFASQLSLQLLGIVRKRA